MSAAIITEAAPIIAEAAKQAGPAVAEATKMTFREAVKAATPLALKVGAGLAAAGGAVAIGIFGKTAYDDSRRGRDYRLTRSGEAANTNKPVTQDEVEAKRQRAAEAAAALEMAQRLAREAEADLHISEAAVARSTTQQPPNADC